MTTTNQLLSERTIRTRVAALEPNPLDNAAMTMAAEAVNSMEPSRSTFSDGLTMDRATYAKGLGRYNRTAATSPNAAAISCRWRKYYCPAANSHRIVR